MESTLRTHLSSTLHDVFGLTDIVYSLEHPKELAHGDYMTNVALIVGKQIGKHPTEVATMIVDALKQQSMDGVGEITVAGPGFINFTLERSVFITKLESIATLGDTWGHTDALKGKKVLVEHSSPNLFKPFHIGHLMNNTVGEAVTRIARASGAVVTAISFPSDISLGVAKAIFVLIEKYGEDFTPTDVTVLGDAYVEGVKQYDAGDVSLQARVKVIADQLYGQIPSVAWTIFQKCKVFNMQYFEQITTKLGSHFDGYIYESEAGVLGKRIVLEYTPKVFTKSEGAVVYIPNESRKDINTSVFINSQGNPTYEAKDVGLLTMKFDRYNPDISLFVTDNQQVEHFKVVLDAMMHIQPEYVAKSVHRTHGRMSFKGQKMSSRLGGVPLAEEVLDTVIEDVKEKNPESTDVSAQMIGSAAIKLAVLRAMAGKDINFDPETSLSFEGDSGPYLQYTVVRAGALIAKGAEVGIKPAWTRPVSTTETLERVIVRYPEIIARAGSEWAPHHIVGYLFELAQLFNSWYGQGKIVDVDESATAYRLAITDAVRQTITNGLDVLGIAVPPKM